MGLKEETGFLNLPLGRAAMPRDYWSVELRRSDRDRRNDSFGRLAPIAGRAIVLRERSGYPVGDLAHGESVLYKQSLVS